MSTKNSKGTTVTGLLEHECREAGLVEVVEVLLPLTCSAHSFPRRLEPWAGRTIGKRGALWWKPWLTVAAQLPPMVRLQQTRLTLAQWGLPPTFFMMVS